MARYNSSSATTTITGTATVTSPYSGAFTGLTGTAPYTVTLPAPGLFPGSNQTFYNSTAGTVTLSTPSGLFGGLGASGSGTLVMLTNTVTTVTSDGTNYIVLSEDGSALVATSGSFTGDVAMNGSLVNIAPSTLTLNPTSSGTLNNVAIGGTTRAAGSFVALNANGQVNFTSNTASSSTSTGSLVVTGGMGVSGTVYAGGFNGNLTGTLQTAAQANITSVGALTGLVVDTNTISVDATNHRLGVGVTNPLSLLDVNGTPTGAASLRTYSDTTGAIAASYAEKRECSFNVTTGSNFVISNITVTSSGWRVIFRGTWSNNYDGGGLTPPAPYIEVNSANPTISVGSRTLTVSLNASNYLQINNNDTYRVTFAGSIEIYQNSQSGQPVNSLQLLGRIGIQNSSPAVPIDINTSNSTTGIKLAYNGGQSLIIAAGSGGAGLWHIGNGFLTLGVNSNGSYTSPTGAALTISNGGNVGIGISPTNPLHVENTSTSTTLNVKNNSSTGYAFSISKLGETYSTSGTSTVTPYEVAGTLGNFVSAPNNVNTGAILTFNAYNSANGATGAYIGAVAGGSGNGPANVVIGRRTGTSTFAESLRIDTAGKPTFTNSSIGLSSNASTIFTAAGSAINNQTISVTISTVEATTCLVIAMHNHYGLLSGYGCARMSMLANGNGGMQEINISSSTSGNGGAWTFSYSSASTFTISKSAGSYIGGGYYTIIVIGNYISN